MVHGRLRRLEIPIPLHEREHDTPLLQRLTLLRLDHQKWPGTCSGPERVGHLSTRARPQEVRSGPRVAHWHRIHDRRGRGHPIRQRGQSGQGRRLGHPQAGAHPRRRPRAAGNVLHRPRERVPSAQRRRHPRRAAAVRLDSDQQMLLTSRRFTPMESYNWPHIPKCRRSEQNRRNISKLRHHPSCEHTWLRARGQPSSRKQQPARRLLSTGWHGLQQQISRHSRRPRQQALAQLDATIRHLRRGPFHRREPAARRARQPQLRSLDGSG